MRSDSMRTLRLARGDVIAIKMAMAEVIMEIRMEMSEAEDEKKREDAKRNAEKWENLREEIGRQLDDQDRAAKEKTMEAVNRNFEDKTILIGIEYEE